MSVLHRFAAHIVIHAKRPKLREPYQLHWMERVSYFHLFWLIEIVWLFSKYPFSNSGFMGQFRARRMKPIIVDPGLYLAEKTGMFYATQKRDFPSAYQLFSGDSAIT